MAVQVNGRVRDRLAAPADVSEDQMRELALASAGVQRVVAGREVKQVVYVPGRVVNIVTE